MYHKQGESFIKHLDFILWDLIIVGITFVLSYVIRHGLQNPFEQQVYVTIFSVFLCAQLLISIFRENYKNILRRGYLVELKAVFLQNNIVMALVLTFMFITKKLEYSRQIFVTMWLFNIFFMYVVHLFWKKHVRKK